jgi:hypothetical protein
LSPVAIRLVAPFVSASEQGACHHFPLVGEGFLSADKHMDYFRIVAEILSVKNQVFP